MTDGRLERMVEIVNPLGFHARPAAEFVRLAGSFQCELWLEKDGVEVNAKSIMGVLMLAAEVGAQLVIRGVGEEAEDALRRSIAIRPSPDNHLHLAWVFYETDRRDRTRSYLLKAEALHPSPDTQARINELNRKLRR